MQHRDMTALVAVAILAILAILLILYPDHQDRTITKQVKSGEYELQCQFRDGWRRVTPDKIDSFIDGRWFFTNGSATNCTMLKGADHAD